MRQVLCVIMPTPRPSSQPRYGAKAGGRSRGKSKIPDHVRRKILPSPPPDAKATTLAATVEAVVFANDDGDFVILRAIDDSESKVVLKGALGHVHVGESLNCTGAWQEHQQHGWAFHVKTAEATQPHTLVGMASYLESAVPGIGPVFARAIVEQFGEETFEMIDANPKVLYKVKTPGGVSMSTAKIRAVIEAWDDARAVRRVMVFLTSHGVTPGLAAKIHKQYGERSLTILQEDPYRIVEIRGVGFKIADRIARNLNVPLHSPQRIKAGLVYCLQEAESSGHCFLTEPELVDTAIEQLVLDDPEMVAEQITELVRDRKLILDVSDGESRCYLPDLYFIERRLGKALRALLDNPPADDVSVPERATATGTDGFVPNDGQWTAIENALSRRVSLISGLPGTGKTTLVRLLLDLIDDQKKLRVGVSEVSYLLGSPTGKAARRMTEATGREAQTIHRMLQWAPSQGGFVHDEDTPLAARFVIVDETSMVDLRLADALVRAIGPETHLILVGDADQLPPVGAGKVFDDLLASSAVPSVRLTEIFRQAARSMIVRNAHQIVHGKKPFKNAKDAAEQLDDVSTEDLDDDFFFVERDDPEDIVNTVVEFAAKRIPTTYKLDPIRDVLVLAPMKKGPCGLEVLNARLQQTLNPNGMKLGVKDLRLGDRVIQTRNDYNLEVMNGEVGVIDFWNKEDRTGVLDLGERRVQIAAKDLESFLPAYAISVHRSQGSQAPAVICVTATSHYIMLTRSLVNTAITRAQKLCVCVGQERALGIAVRTVDARKRNSALAERVRGSRRRPVGAAPEPDQDSFEVDIAGLDENLDLT